MLINCVAYQDGRKLADLPVEQISNYVVRPDCFVWVALRDATDAARADARARRHAQAADRGRRPRALVRALRVACAAPGAQSFPARVPLHSRFSIEDTPVLRVTVLQGPFDLAAVVRWPFGGVFNEIEAHPHRLSGHDSFRRAAPGQERQDQERDGLAHYNRKLA